MKHCTVTFRPDKQTVSIHQGATLLEAAGRAGIILNTTCGGKGICGKCAVTLEPGQKQVLACQYRVESDLTVTIPVSSRFFEQQILTEGTTPQRRITPDIYENHVATGAAVILGVAVDIGTTTVVAKLLDMKDGRRLATESALNPQSRHGDDVVTRISYAGTDEKLTELHNLIIGCVNDLIARLCKKASVRQDDIYETCVVGNTTMGHLFLKFPVEQLGLAPYKAYSLDAHDVPVSRVGLNMNPAGNIHTVENIAGYVGADTTAVALATGIDSAEQVTLAVDIGTNGELVLAAGGRLYAASCAAGPALEGARITCGSRAVQGAIQGIIQNSADIELDVIGDVPAVSICGSGLIDAVAVLLDLGVIDKTGRFTDPGNLAAAIASRVFYYNDQPAFMLARGGGDMPDVFVTQADIREFQLSKGAIRAGIKILQKRVGLKDTEIDRILLAGAFGNYIRAESALRSGLLPELPCERLHFVGNAAAVGAEMLLLSSRCRKLAGQLAQRIEYVEIAHERQFGDIFADSMFLP